jgi:hypothetical protein
MTFLIIKNKKLRWPETPKLRIDGSAPNDSDVNPKKKKKCLASPMDGRPPNA